MTWLRAVIAALVMGVCGGARIVAQDVPAKNPLEGDADAIRTGMALFRGNCTDCHGMDARGIRAPDITQVWTSGRTDAGLFQTVRHGIPNTEMPPVGPRTYDAEVWKILAYLKTLSTPAVDTPRGNAENGERVFRANCGSYHRVNARGGVLGPDLSRIGASRSRDVLLKQIRRATEDFKDGYAPVTLMTPNGQAIRGVKKNEDLFSIQIMDTRERIQGYTKDQLREVVNERRSAMPSFGPDRLSDADLDDLLRYLSGLRGQQPADR